MDETQLKLEVRFAAIELTIAKLAQLVYVNAGLSAEHVAILHATIREGMRNATIPGADPALSDLGAAELADAVDHLLSVIEQIAGLANKRES